MRLFVAVDVEGPEAPGPSHLTLAFLGEVPDARVAEVEAALPPVATSAAPFAMRLEGVGAFPSRERPRVVWQGVGAGAAELESLASRTRAALRAWAPGLERDRFVPHVTLFRVRTLEDRRRARELLDGAVPPPPSRELRIDALRLKASELAPGGARHRTIRSFPLGP